MRQKSQRALHPLREAPPQSLLSSTLPAMPASQHGSTSTWIGVTTRVLGQISTSLPSLHLNWPRSARKLWRKPRGKQNRKQEKRRRGNGRGKKREKESGNERRKQSEQQKPPVLLMRAEWVSLKWPAPPTCVLPLMAHPLRLQLCLRTSALTPLPCAPSASTHDLTSCPPPIETIPSSCPSTLQTPCWPITCPACTTLTQPCGSGSYESGRCERGRFVRGS